jgi:aminopeptidase
LYDKRGEKVRGIIMKNNLNKLADTIVNYSLRVKKNDRILITTFTNKPNELVKKIIRLIYHNGAIPFVRIMDPEINALLGECTSRERIDELVKLKQYDIDNYDGFITIKYLVNEYEEKYIPKETLKILGEKTREIDDIRINQRRWVLLNYPSVLDAYKSKMKIDEFYNYAMNIMMVDYRKMKKEIRPLKELMEKTDKVRIVGPDTDLTFSIKGIPIIPCIGERNIPDGEIFTAPIKTSVNGTIRYNTDSPYQGEVYRNIFFRFKDGKIIEARCENNTEDLNIILDTDEGSRYIGEFSLGLNPKMTHPLGDILYDEKILGSIHFTPGRAYKDSYNGNDSSVHWDIVLIQRKEYGGGEIYFDDVLIRKDGFFVLDDLKHLNYELDKNSL